MRKQVAVLL